MVLLRMHMMCGSHALDVASYRVLEIGRTGGIDADKPCVVDGEAGLNLWRVLLLVLLLLLLLLLILQGLLLTLLILLLQSVLLLRAQLARLLQLLMLLLTVRYASAGWRSGGRARTPLGVAIRAGVGKVVGRKEGGDGWLAWALVPVCGAGEVLVCAEWHSCGERAGGR